MLLLTNSPAAWRLVLKVEKGSNAHKGGRHSLRNEEPSPTMEPVEAPRFGPTLRDFFSANCRDCDKVAYELRLSVAGGGTPSDRERGSVGRN